MGGKSSIQSRLKKEIEMSLKETKRRARKYLYSDDRRWAVEG